MTSVHRRMGEFGHRDTYKRKRQGEHYMMSEVETGGAHLSARQA